MSNIYYEKGSEWEKDQRKYSQYIKDNGIKSLHADWVTFDPVVYAASLDDAAIANIRKYGTSVSWNMRTHKAIHKAVSAEYSEREANKGTKTPTHNGMSETGEQLNA